MENQITIERWMKKISSLNYKTKILYFNQLIELFSEESFSVENIFLILYKKGFIGSHSSKVELIKEALSSGLKPEFNSIRFYVTTEGSKFIETLLTWESSKGDNNQLEFNFNN